MDRIFRLFTDSAAFPLWGLAGSMLVLAGCVIPALRYKGKLGQRYSLLNHFISELGERPVSTFAGVFNAALVAAGLCYVLFMVQFGAFLGTLPAGIAGTAGVFSALACCMVGVFPMDTLKKHDDAAKCFFYGGLATILLFGLASLLDSGRRLPLVFVLFAVAVALAFAAFLLIPVLTPRREGKYDYFGADRPRVWLMPVFEWLAMLGVVGWVAAVSMYFI
jgi:hypothetical membrane protein